MITLLLITSTNTILKTQTSIKPMGHKQSLLYRYISTTHTISMTTFYLSCPPILFVKLLRVKRKLQHIRESIVIQTSTFYLSYPPILFVNQFSLSAIKDHHARETNVHKQDTTSPVPESHAKLLGKHSQTLLRN